MTLYPKIRAIHLSTALLSAIFLLAYAISAVEFAHRKWVSHRERSTVEYRKLTPGITDARILARAWRGELTSIEQTPSAITFRVTSSLGKIYDVSYSHATGDTRVKTTTNSFLSALAWIHVSQGIWAWVAALVSLGLLTLGATGIYLWFNNCAERWIGSGVLLMGAGLTLALIISMR